MILDQKDLVSDLVLYVSIYFREYFFHGLGISGSQTKIKQS
jgi:hypothetical protein